MAAASDADAGVSREILAFGEDIFTKMKAGLCGGWSAVQGTVGSGIFAPVAT